MVRSETGKIFIVIGVLVSIIGAIMIVFGFTQIFSQESPNLVSYITLGSYVISGGISLCTLGIVIYFVGDKDVICSSCGALIEGDLYICPSCNSKTPNYYHQKVSCSRCFQRSRYDKHGGRCKYCGNPLELP